MNFTESFNDFSSRLGPTDLALYAGVGLVLWVLFKDKMSPVQVLIQSVIDKLKSLFANNTKPSTVVTNPSIPAIKTETTTDEDIFFQLIASWKQTRDLAVRSKCVEAVRVADQMFPYLSPNVCTKKEEQVNEK
jgi:hypothetical protein